jgi:hypothetical protein
MNRVLLSVGLSLVALGVGFFTACRVAKNRARAAELDARERWCETFSRQNELLQEEVLEGEWRVQHELRVHPPESRARAEAEQ